MSSQRILEKWKLWFKNQNLICNKLESWRHIEIIFHFLVSNHENLTKATKIWHEKLFFLCSNLSNSIWNTNYTVWSRFETAKCHSTSCSSFKGKQLLSWCWIPDLIRKKKTQLQFTTYVTNDWKRMWYICCYLTEHPY